MNAKGRKIIKFKIRKIKKKLCPVFIAALV